MTRWFLPLTPEQTTGIMLEGLDAISGPVLPEDEARFPDPDAVRTAFGHPDPAPGAGRFVDHLLLPELPGVRVVDGVLAPTRVPSGTSYWRLEADGTHVLVSFYDTPAYGWRNMRGPVRPAEDVGLRARWNGLDLVAAPEEGVEGLHLVAVSDTPPEGFAWTKFGVSRRTVPWDECEVRDAATGEPVRPSTAT